jgi:type VI secretion system secreted protein VgrG
MVCTTAIRSILVLTTGVGLAAALALGTASGASAATVISGPVDLGSAATYGVLGAEEVTNTGQTRVVGDLGIAPGTSVTGFGGAPDGTVSGETHVNDADAVRAKSDALIAYDTAESLSPTTSGVEQLAGLSLSPGVYNGTTLDLAANGTLTLAGSARSVWVFQASSSLTVGSATHILFSGGASACNVFWQVGSSATIGTTADFAGTVLAQQSVTANTSATVVGRLFAANAAVTLDRNTITVPSGCPQPGVVSETVAPTITPGTPPTATAGTPYSYTVTATGSPAPTYTVTGSLPAGLTFDGSTGTISGTPTTPGTSTFTVTADNGTAPTSSATYSVTVAAAAGGAGTTPGAGTPGATTPGASTPGVTTSALRGGTGGTGGPQLAETGAESAVPAGIAGVLLAAGLVLSVVGARRRRTPGAHV